MLQEKIQPGGFCIDPQEMKLSTFGTVISQPQMWMVFNFHASDLNFKLQSNHTYIYGCDMTVWAIKAVPTVDYFLLIYSSWVYSSPSTLNMLEIIKTLICRWWSGAPSWQTPKVLSCGGEHPQIWCWCVSLCVNFLMLMCQPLCQSYLRLTLVSPTISISSGRQGCWPISGGPGRTQLLRWLRLFIWLTVVR